MKKIPIILYFTVILGIVGCDATNELNGRLYVAGNEPFTYLALDTEEGITYKIECADSLKKDLWQLQGETVNLYYEEIKKYDKLTIAVVNRYSVKDLNKGK